MSRGQQCWKGAHKTPLDPFWTPLSLLNPSLVPRPTWDIHVSRGTRLPQSPQWSPNEHHQVAPSDHPSHPIYKPSSCLIMFWHSQNCHRNSKKLRYSFYIPTGALFILWCSFYSLLLKSIIDWLSYNSILITIFGGFDPKKCMTECVVAFI